MWWLLIRYRFTAAPVQLLHCIYWWLHRFEEKNYSTDGCYAIVYHIARTDTAHDTSIFHHMRTVPYSSTAYRSEHVSGVKHPRS